MAFLMSAFRPSTTRAATALRSAPVRGVLLPGLFTLGALAALAALAGAAGAAEVDYVGYAWETGGLVVSQPGDRLAVATVITQIDPMFGVDLGAQEATLYIEGLVSEGAATDPVTGATVISYAGGTLEVHAGAARNHDWGTSPANATVPSTFTDGALVFSGVFRGFTLSLMPSGVGIFEGQLDGTGGSALGGPCANCAYTFAGTFAGPTGANIPAGYDLQVDGLLSVERAVATQSSSWGSLKQLFNTAR